MAKTGINIEKCNVYKAEKHNGRDQAYIDAVNKSKNKTYSIFADMTPTNKTWRNPDERYQDKSLVQLLNDIRKEVKEKTGQKLQEKDRIRKVKDKKTGEFKEKIIPGSSPIREGVCPIKEDTKIEDFKPVIDWLAERHVKVIRIDIHNDEGHVDVETKERKYNRHAHLIFDWMLHENLMGKDPKTGKEKVIQKAGTSVKLNKQDMSELQTVLADALGMERGESKEVTRAEHLKALEFRLQETAKDVERLEKKNEDLKKENEDLKEQKREELRKACSNLQLVGKNNVIQFDRTVHMANGAVPPTDQEKADRDSLDQESKRDLSEMTQAQLVTEDAMLRRLIDHTYRAIDRIGKKIIEIANNVPRLSLFSNRQRELLAREAEMEQKVADAQSEAEKAVEQAKNDQKTAIAAAQQAANAKVAAAKEEARLAKEEAAKAETEAKKRSTAALSKEQEARNEVKKYQNLNANLEQKITEAKTAAKQEGYDSGYSIGYGDGKKDGEEKRTELIQEIRAMEVNHSHDVTRYKNKVMQLQLDNFLFKATNPLLQDFERNQEELKKTGLEFTREEMVRLFSGEIVKKEYTGKRKSEEYSIEVSIDIAKNTEGNMRVWFNDLSLEKFKEDFERQVDELIKSQTKTKTYSKGFGV